MCPRPDPFRPEKGFAGSGDRGDDISRRDSLPHWDCLGWEVELCTDPPGECLSSQGRPVCHQYPVYGADLADGQQLEPGLVSRTQKSQGAAIGSGQQADGHGIRCGRAQRSQVRRGHKGFGESCFRIKQQRGGRVGLEALGAIVRPVAADLEAHLPAALDQAALDAERCSGIRAMPLYDRENLGQALPVFAEHGVDGLNGVGHGHNLGGDFLTDKLHGIPPYHQPEKRGQTSVTSFPPVPMT